MTRLHLDGLVREFGATTAVDDVSIDVADGEFFTLVGPSGCGKTTTLRLIAGFEEPDAGDVRFGGDGASDGESMTGVPPEQRDVGIVFQSYALFPHMTVGENVAYGLRFRDPPGGVSKQERVAELLELVDLPGMEDRSPDELSGGQQQRVALARALAPGPSVLLLDEPMSALDARLRERLRGQVKEIQRELEITTVYVTHDQEEALSISDRVAVMNGGRVEQVGTPEEVYREPASRFVAEFVGDNNVFHGEATPLQTGSEQQSPPSERAALDREQSEPPLETEGSSVVVDSGSFVVADSVSGDVTVSVRPESLSFDSGPNQLAVEVKRVEFLGDVYKVHCDWNGTPLLVKANAAPEPGPATVSFAPEDADVVARE